MTYMSVERPTIQKAFALAHKAACDEKLTPANRKRFKEIALAIWQACGEPHNHHAGRTSRVCWRPRSRRTRRVLSGDRTEGPTAMMPTTDLDRNLVQLSQATGEVRMEAADDATRSSSVHRFFHLLLLECAERMTPQDFRHAIEIAREQLKRPL